MAGQRRSSTVDVNSAAFLAGLHAEIGRMKLRSEADLMRLALGVQNRARELAPVDTGRLRSSITHKRGKDRLGPYVKVGTNVEYAPYVEFGTRYQRAQPFLRPAIAEAVSDWNRRR